MLANGMQLLADQWRLLAAQVDPLISSLLSLVGPPAVLGPRPLDPAGQTRFPHTAVFFPMHWPTAGSGLSPYSSSLACRQETSATAVSASSHPTVLSNLSRAITCWPLACGDQIGAGLPVLVSFDNFAMVFLQSCEWLCVTLPAEQRAPSHGR